jgi:integrase
LALRWQDLDLDARRLYIHRTLRRQHRAGVVFGPPKTNRSRRPVVLSELAVEALRRHRLRRDDEAAMSRESCDLVFTNCRGGPLEPAAPGKILNRALEDAGLPHIRVHDLLGHSSIRTTLDTYSHAMPVLHEDAVAELDDLLR